MQDVLLRKVSEVLRTRKSSCTDIAKMCAVSCLTGSSLSLLLELNTFFTSGPEESRAWTIKKNTLAPKAASVIHTDFEKNFIRAEAVTCEDFIKFGSTEKCKENGKLRIEGKDYIVKDGDVLYFRVNP